MSFYTPRFNIYLFLAAVLLGLSGCQSDQTKAEKAQAKKLSALRVNIETKDDSLGEHGTTCTIQFPRQDPVNISIAREPILMESDITKAVLMPSPGGFAVEVQFDEMGAITLEQFTAANPGKHLVIFGQWGDGKKEDGDQSTGTNNDCARWLAAPLISHRIADGILAFTPDATRAEADRLVLGLNNVAKKLKQGNN